MTEKQMYYNDYLQIDKILDAQSPESDKQNVEAHDEMLFIIVHQVYELWFKQILFEMDSVIKIFSNPINDNSSEMQIAVHRLKRVVAILRLGVDQINIMETMTPLDFLDFRDLLRPASGFQSIQFKLLEAALGLKEDQRHGKDYFISQLRKEHADLVRSVEKKESFVELINAWLERMPYFDQKFWPEASGPDDHPFWKDYRTLYEHSLLDVEKGNMEFFDQRLFKGGVETNRLSPTAARAGLFIMLYRDFPLLQLPYQLLDTLLDIDEMMATWRYRHMNMVHRIIGRRVGTGGSTGKNYLKGALDKHYIFSEVADLTSFLIERRSLPRLPQPLQDTLKF